MVAGDKASSGSIAKVARCLLLLLAGEASEQQTVVARGVVRPLTVEASGGNVTGVAGYPLLLPPLLLAGEVRRAANYGDRRRGAPPDYQGQRHQHPQYSGVCAAPLGRQDER